jgi:phosphonate transport system substrate-binding protein
VVQKVEYKSWCRRHWLVASTTCLLSRPAFAASVLCPPPSSLPPRRGTLIFGLITPRASEQTEANWRPFLQRMGQAIGRPVLARSFAMQGELVDAFRTGEVDLAWMGNAPALEVVESGAGAVFAQMVTRDGKVGYHSVLVVPHHSPLRSTADMLAAAPGLRFGDGDAKSTSGHLVPQYYVFLRNGITDMKAAFKSVAVGNHQTNLQRVAAGELEVATANDEELAFFKRDFPALGDKVRVIWESLPIPQSPLVWRLALPKPLRRRIQDFTLAFGLAAAEEKAILLRVNDLSGFRRSGNGQLITVADIELFRARRAIENNEQLSGAERKQRTEDLMVRSARLELKLRLGSPTDL